MVSWSQTPSDTSWPRTLGQMLNYTYPQGGATLNLGLHTFLARGQVYLVNKVHVGTHSLDSLSVHKGFILTSSSPVSDVHIIKLCISIGKSPCHCKRGHCAKHSGDPVVIA
ncbi:hypothetical protein DPMN_022800 [Dreissena polymorpha]|uniref:Uncharacterized protein n=1 Tax=Dreissena polymorpha TaxID=45954 RepID=A0A9D4NKY7_DREPO|nr:hypothetical protein DPMN_022800 [Dreissena polymorpha]